MHFKREWVATFFILIISWCSYEGYEGSIFLSRIPLYQKHIINFTLLFAVAAIGYYVWSKDNEKWTKPIWVILYAAVILLMLSVGLIDLFHKFRIGNFREMVHNLRLFFTSPVPFGILLFLKKRYKNKISHP